MISPRKHSTNPSMGKPINKARDAGRKKRGSKDRWMSYKTSIYILIMLAIIAGSFWAGQQVLQRAEVSDIRVSGNYFTGDDEIVEATGLQEGIPLDSISYLSVIDKIEQLPYIRRADIDVSISGRLTAQVKEREPIALLAQDGMDYVDTSGVRLPAVSGKSVDVPLLYLPASNVRADSIKGEEFSRMADFLAVAKSEGMPFYTIGEVGYDSEEGVVALSDDSAARLVFGHENFEIRIKNWRKFYSEVIPEKGMHQMRRIDMRFENQIVTRER